MVFENYSAQFDDNEKLEPQEKSPWKWMSDEDLIEDQSQRIQEYVESTRYQELISRELRMESLFIQDDIGESLDRVLDTQIWEWRLKVFPHKKLVTFDIWNVTLPLVYWEKNMSELIIQTIMLLNSQTLTWKPLDRQTEQRLVSTYHVLMSMFPFFPNIIQVRELTNIQLITLKEMSELDLNMMMIQAGKNDDLLLQLYDLWGVNVSKDIRNKSKDTAAMRVKNLEGKVHVVPWGAWNTTLWFYKPIWEQKEWDWYNLPEDMWVRDAVDAYTWIDKIKRALSELEQQLLYSESNEEREKIQKKIDQLKSDIKAFDIQSGEIVLMTPSKYKFTMIHEKAHQLLDWNAQMIQTTRNFLADLLYVNKQDYALERYGKEIVNYAFSISEVYANIIAVKYLMDRFNIIDPLKEPIKFDDLKVLCKKVSKLKEWDIKESAKHVVMKILDVMRISFDDIIQNDYQIDENTKHKIMHSLFNWIALQLEKSQEVSWRV